MDGLASDPAGGSGGIGLDIDAADGIKAGLGGMFTTAGGVAGLVSGLEGIGGAGGLAGCDETNPSGLRSSRVSRFDGVLISGLSKLDPLGFCGKDCAGAIGAIDPETCGLISSAIIRSGF